ncbi:MAG: hypothetical protein MI924_08320 [Chloroflexales bacterium]|nr:hypothetical protein [Chloroflexales bacterium]
MGIIIEAINAANVQDVNTCDGEFSIDAKLAVSVEEDNIRYQVVKIPCTKKRYAYDEIDYTAYIDDPDKIVFLAQLMGS